VLSVAASHAGADRANWVWLLVFFVVFTFGELHILPTGLGLLAGRAPPGFGATTVAAWFLAIFGGSAAAGAVGAP
jgi:POT family proton-dependent oligopeptide transporter